MSVLSDMEVSEYDSMDQDDCERVLRSKVVKSVQARTSAGQHRRVAHSRSRSSSPRRTNVSRSYSPVHKRGTKVRRPRTKISMYVKKSPVPPRRIRVLVPTHASFRPSPNWYVFDALQGCRYLSQSIQAKEEQADALSHNLFDTILCTIGDLFFFSVLAQYCQTLRERSTVVIVGIDHGSEASKQLVRRLVGMGAIELRSNDQRIPHCYDFMFR